MTSEEQPLVRLQVYLARGGIGSRRRCETYIEQGLVSVDGMVVTTPGTKVTGEEQILFNGHEVTAEKKKRYLAVNKPRGYICTSDDPFGRPIASSLFAHAYKERMFHVGRLDIDSEGLILFTNDGAFSRIVTHPSSRIEKEYLVETPNRVSKDVFDGFVRGVTWEGVRYTIDSYTLLGNHRVMLRLHEGKKREIRELFRSAGCRVGRLKRVRIGIVSIDVPVGAFRELTGTEVEWFMRQGEKG